MGKTLIRLLLQKQSDLGLHCLSRLFWQATSVLNFRTYTIHDTALYLHSTANSLTYISQAKLIQLSVKFEFILMANGTSFLSRNQFTLWINLHTISLFDLILYVPSTIFQLCRDGSSWVEPVLSWINVSCSRTQHSDAGEAWTCSPSVLSQALLPLRHCAPLNIFKLEIRNPLLSILVIDTFILPFLSRFPS